MNDLSTDRQEEELPQPAPQSTAWLVTFTDLVSLMLTFFVMLFAMSNVKVDRWSDMIDTLSQSLNPARTTVTVTTSDRYNIASIFRKRAINLDYMAAVLGETVGTDPILQQSRIIRLEDRLVIAIPGDLLFAPGRAVLTERARQALFNLGGVMRNIDNQMGVNGHTDPTSPSGTDYSSNWELSLARAITVANSLRSSGYRQVIIANGFADSRYSDLPDLPEEERNALARRVDIVIRPTVGSD